MKDREIIKKQEELIQFLEYQLFGLVLSPNDETRLSQLQSSITALKSESEPRGEKTPEDVMKLADEYTTFWQELLKKDLKMTWKQISEVTIAFARGYTASQSSKSVEPRGETAEEIFNIVFKELKGESGCYHFPKLKELVLLCMEECKNTDLRREEFILHCFAEYWNNTIEKDPVSHIYSSAIERYFALHKNRKKQIEDKVDEYLQSRETKK